MLTLDNRNDHWRSDPASAGSAIADAAQLLRAAGIDDGTRDSRSLVAAAAGLDPAVLLSRPEHRLTASQQELLQTYIRRRIAREPVSRILGRRGFHGRDFLITPATLDPRPESETLIGATLQLAAEEGWDEAAIRIFDVGTGSGCLLVTLLAELPIASGVGSDIDTSALLAAAANAERHGALERSRFIQTRSLGAVEGTFDLLVANPPYIPTADVAGLEPEVRVYDPPAALDGGSDGLDIDLARVVPDGWAVFEVGAGQADAVAGLLAGAAEGAAVRRFLDLDGRERCVAWKARASAPRTKALGIRGGPE